jgi:hypothetical protein
MSSERSTLLQPTSYQLGNASLTSFNPRPVEGTIRTLSGDHHHSGIFPLGSPTAGSYLRRSRHAVEHNRATRPELRRGQRIENGPPHDPVSRRLHGIKRVL